MIKKTPHETYLEKTISTELHLIPSQDKTHTYIHTAMHTYTCTHSYTYTYIRILAFNLKVNLMTSHFADIRILKKKKYYWRFLKNLYYVTSLFHFYDPCLYNVLFYNWKIKHSDKKIGFYNIYFRLTFVVNHISARIFHHLQYDKNLIKPKQSLNQLYKKLQKYIKLIQTSKRFSKSLVSKNQGCRG